MARALAATALALGAALAAPAPAGAHAGPPYPLIVDARIGTYVVSVWADPDIGVGTFYVVVEATAGAAPAPPSRVRVHVRPVSNRIRETSHDGVPQAARVGAQFAVEVPFDRGEFWNVRVEVAGPGGRGELTAEVEATPDGTLGPIGLVVYAVPFLLVAALWVRVTMVRRRMRVRPGAPSAGSSA